MTTLKERKLMLLVKQLKDELADLKAGGRDNEFEIRGTLRQTEEALSRSQAALAASMREARMLRTVLYALTEGGAIVAKEEQGA